MGLSRFWRWFMWPGKQIFWWLHQLRVPKEDWTVSDVEGILQKGLAFSFLLYAALIGLLIRYLLKYFSVIS